MARLWLKLVGVIIEIVWFFSKAVVVLTVIGYLTKTGLYFHDFILNLLDHWGLIHLNKTQPVYVNPALFSNYVGFDPLGEEKERPDNKFFHIWIAVFVFFFIGNAMN